MSAAGVVCLVAAALTMAGGAVMIVRPPASWSGRKRFSALVMAASVVMAVAGLINREGATTAAAAQRAATWPQEHPVTVRLAECPCSCSAAGP